MVINNTVPDNCISLISTPSKWFNFEKSALFTRPISKLIGTLMGFETEFITN